MKRSQFKTPLILATAFLVIVSVLGGCFAYVAARRSLLPDNMNMSPSGMSSMTGMQMDAMDITSHSTDATSISQLTTPETNAPVRSFTLTAQITSIDLGVGKTIEAYTYNRQIPGPELRVQQGDMVVITLINELPVSTSIHWHGISVPNAEDGVAGVTQDAVPPHGTYTYRFIALDIGTYWYHSHQQTSIQLPRGLYGAIIVEPKEPPVRYDHDYTVFLHEWNASPDCQSTCVETLSVNNRVNQISFAANPGERVRLRLVNSGDDDHLPALIGAPFQVIALDGHMLNGPTSLETMILPISAGQRYDLSFVMPSSGAVALIDADTRAEPQNQHPTVLIGSGPALSYPENAPQFDFSTYGVPTQDEITLSSHFDVQYDMLLNNQLGFFNGQFTMRFPINDETYPNIPSLRVNLGNLVKIHLSNVGDIPHAMHLHGHVFTVLTANGKPLSGSPIHLDTISVKPGESYDVAFRADNPGLWMLHCHIVAHDARGMDMMLEYPNLFTPYSIGTQSGNNPF